MIPALPKRVTNLHQIPRLRVLHSDPLRYLKLHEDGLLPVGHPCAEAQKRALFQHDCWVNCRLLSSSRRGDISKTRLANHKTCHGLVPFISQSYQKQSCFLERDGNNSFSTGERSQVGTQGKPGCLGDFQSFGGSTVRTLDIWHLQGPLSSQKSWLLQRMLKWKQKFMKAEQMTAIPFQQRPWSILGKKRVERWDGSVHRDGVDLRDIQIHFTAVTKSKSVLRWDTTLHLPPKVFIAFPLITGPVLATGCHWTTLSAYQDRDLRKNWATWTSQRALF